MTSISCICRLKICNFGVNYGFGKPVSIYIFCKPLSNDFFWSEILRQHFIGIPVFFEIHLFCPAPKSLVRLVNYCVFLLHSLTKSNRCFRRFVVMTMFVWIIQPLLISNNNNNLKYPNAEIAIHSNNSNSLSRLSRLQLKHHSPPYSWLYCDGSTQCFDIQ